MEQLNRIELRGNVGSVKFQKIGDSTMARINLATNHAYNDRNGAAVIETTWHNVIVWDVEKHADLENIEKGCKLYVMGRLRVQKYTGSDEIERTSYEVLANRVSVINDSEPLQCEF